MKKRKEQCPDTQGILSGLKDFQRKTVEYVYRRMYTDEDRVNRFLVADEVGLGKTLVARGLIAKAIEHLWPTDRRIDVVYVCSNAEIARQNIGRLNVTQQKNCSNATRITLLATTLRHLNEQRINFVSFTPSTSFELNQTGWSRERELLYYLITNERENTNFNRVTRVLEAGAKTENFRERVKSFPTRHPTPHPKIAHKFWKRLQAHPDLLQRFDDLTEAMPRSGVRLSAELEQDRNAMVGELRKLLAEASLEYLEPDLVILDEFQRFKDLLCSDSSQASDAADLANRLFNFQEDENDKDTAARVLLLSATPYKMYTMHHEREQDDHYADFNSTLKFLFTEEKDRVGVLEQVNKYRECLLRVGDDNGSGLIAAKHELEAKLRKVIARTERLASSVDRGGMLAESLELRTELTAQDINQYLQVQGVAKSIEHSDILQYWKSAPYLLNFMDEYDVKRKVNNQLDVSPQDPAFVKSLKAAESTMLSKDDVEAYAQIDPANAQLRALHKYTIGRHAWRLLWVPPSRPYYQPSGNYADEGISGFTKQLVFSCWKVVPKVIAGLLSYDAERAMFQSYRKKALNTAEARAKRPALLRFANGRSGPAGMPTFALMYPCRFLAELVHPRALGSTEATPTLNSTESIVASVELSIATELNDELASFSSLPGDEDQAWYWAALLLLDKRKNPETMDAWLGQVAIKDLRSQNAESGAVNEQDGWHRHLERAQEYLTGKLQLGRPPADLPKVLAHFALAGPGTVAYRALLHTELTRQTDRDALAIAAMRIGNSFLHLFNLTEVIAMVRDRTDLPYWRSVLAYCLDGNLQAVMDEYLHVLSDSPGVEVTSDGEQTEGASDPCHNIADEISKSLELRTSSVQADTYQVNGRTVRAGEAIKFRSRFAMRFGDQRNEDGTDGSRKDQVRTAFNSPFWPFVLATTSVGQEGLDFHRYCHSVVHWNLPSNPVDLEQREGRVHRYKGHALRKNIAHKHGNALIDSCDDLWRRMFELAHSARQPDQNDLFPYWISDGPHKILRHVPALPLSRELVHKSNLLRSLTVYRMVFGQTRQEDLVRYLLQKMQPEQIQQLVDQCRISLAPV